MDLVHSVLAPLPLTLLALALPLALSYLYRQNHHTTPNIANATKPADPWLLRAPRAALVLLHTLFMLHTLTFARPPNLFRELGLPLGAPISQLRRRAIASANGAVTPSFDALLTRLASFDIRIALVRFGQPTVQACTYCRAPSDFALHVFPRALLAHVRVAALAALLTPAGSRRRTYAVAGVVVAAAAETYWAWAAPVTIAMPSEPDSPMWHDVLWLLRQTLHLALPLALFFAPPAPDGAPPAQSTAPLMAALHAASSALARAHLLRYSRAATLRDPVLRARAHAFWAREHAEGEAVRADAGVRRAAAAAGKDFWEAGEGGVGSLRAFVRDALGQLKGAYAGGWSGA